MNISSTIKFSFDSSSNAEIFYKSYLPELANLPQARSTTKMEINSSNQLEIIFTIDALDATAFRATINSVIVAASTIQDITTQIDKSKI